MASIYRRGRVYWARAQRGGREFRESLKTSNRRLADKRYRQWIDRLEAISWGDRPRYTFEEAVKRFIGEHLPTLKPSSARRYGISLKWLADKFEAVYLDQITRDKLAEFETWRRSAGTAAPTVRRDLACLSSLLASCEEWNWIEDGKNLVPGFLRRRARRGLRESPPRTRYMTGAEEAKLLSAATPAVRNAIAVAVDTGLRREELFSLTWPQVDFRRGVIATTKRTKSGRARTVPLPDRAAQILARLKEPSRGVITSLYVFRHEDGSRLMNMEKGLRGAVRRAGLSDLCWHDLRRTAACRWLQRDGRSMEEVSILLGHSSVTVTETRYAFLENEKVAGEVAQLSAHGGADYGKIGNETKAL